MKAIYSCFSRNVISVQFSNFVMSRRMATRSHCDLKPKKLKTSSNSSFLKASIDNLSDTNINEVLHTDNNIKYFTSPTKSLSDKKEYRVVQLKNGLKALLISDVTNLISLEENTDSSVSSESESDGSNVESDDEHSEESLAGSDECQTSSTKESDEKLAAVGLCIGVGSFSDPSHIPGMAHFLEHMVFMGSEKYPQENDFDAFLTKRGGTDNASTDYEHTTFNFECQEKHLEEAMDRFSQFFICPLMKREAMQREREAIESEFQMAVPSDAYRKQQILCSLAQVGHPINKFTWGNLKTLKDNVTDDQLYSAVHEFRQQHYSSHRMTLAVQARLPLSILETWVVKSFSGVPNNRLPPQNFETFSGGVSFKTPHFSKLYRVEPVKDTQEVELCWVMPSLLNFYRSKPHHYLSSLIGHEGKGSLLSYLRKKVWVLELYSGNSECDFEHNSMYAMFTVTFLLTDEGMKHLQQVLEALFGYLRLLQASGPNESYFKEIQTIADLSFRYEEESSAWDYTEVLSENMHFYPPEDYITGSDLFYEYNPQAIQNCLERLVPDRVNIMLFNKNEEMVFDQTEPWFNTRYCVSEIPTDWLESWKKVEPHPSFTLPQPNIFIPGDLSVVPLEDIVEPYPVKIHHNEQSEVWFRRDVKFKQPIAYYYYYFISPLLQVSPQNRVMLDLYCSLLKQLVAEEAYPAKTAKLTYDIYVEDRGFVVKVGGFNDKLRLLLTTILNHMVTFEESLTEEMFDALKDQESRNYFNNFLKPSQLSRDLRLALLLQSHWTNVDKHTVCHKVDLQMMKTFSRQLLEQLYIQSLVQGNVLEQDALDACSNIVHTLKCGLLPPESRPKMRVVKVPLGEIYSRIPSFNKEDSNSLITNYYQSEPGSIKNTCIIELLMMLMEEPLFNNLRTKEQLGYSVSCELRDTFGILGFTLRVNFQANKHSADYIDERIEEFLKTFSKFVKTLPSEDLKEVRNSIIKLKESTDLYLREEVTRNWHEIINQEYVFDRRTKEIKLLQEITLKELQIWLEDHLSNGNQTKFRKLSIQVVGHVRPSDGAEEHECIHNLTTQGSVSKYSFQFVTDTQTKSDQRFITDIDVFKSNVVIYPFTRIVS